MSQPNSRSCTAPIPGELNDDLGEFWIDDPWQINRSHNLSSFEKNQFFMNVEGKDFLNLSYISGADSDGDARCAVAVDFSNSGTLDLVVRQVGGGGLIIYKNNIPAGHWLNIHLHGNPSNSLGIGAKVSVHLANGRTLHQSMFPVNSFRSQAPPVLHFGLGDSEHIKAIKIHWPSGKISEFEDIETNQSLLIKEWDEAGHIHPFPMTDGASIN